MLKDLNNSRQVSQTLNDIRSGKAGRDRVLVRLYKDEKLRLGMRSVILKMGGTHENFNEIFSTTLMQFVKTVIQRPDLIIKNELNTYIIAIAKYVWLANRRKEDKSYEGDDHRREEDDRWENCPESLVIKKEKILLLEGLMEKLGKNCKEVLIHWANGYRMKEIAEIMGYKSADMAKKKKYQCFKALLTYIENNPHVKSALR